MDENWPTSVPSSKWRHSRDPIGRRAIIFPRTSSCRSSAATRCIASRHLHVTRDHLHSSSVQLARIWHGKNAHPHTPRCGRPQGAVNAVPSMLNLGSPSPLLPAVPLGFVVCCMIASTEMYASISRRNDGSPLETKSSMRSLNTRAESRVQEYK
jgi:hypothetical protein